MGCPNFAEFRRQRVLVRLEIAHQFPWNRSGECLVGRLGPIAGIAQHAHFVFHLHHHHRVPLAVHLVDVPHERPVGPRVGITAGVPEGAEQLDALSALDLDPREARVILLHPGWGIAGKPVLPTAEPKEDHKFEQRFGQLD
jgi:hypothetical protein